MFGYFSRLIAELDTFSDEHLEKTMFGLFEFTYDYYEWTSLVCVSIDPQKLKDYWEAERDGKPLAHKESEHRSYAKKEETHYKIQPIKCV